MTAARLARRPGEPVRPPSDAGAATTEPEREPLLRRIADRRQQLALRLERCRGGHQP